MCIPLELLLWGILSGFCVLVGIYMLVKAYRSRKAHVKCSICGGRIEDGGYWKGNSICVECYKALSAYRYALGLTGQSPMHERALRSEKETQ